MDGKAHLAVRFVQDLLGLSRMADASRGLTYHLVDVVQWHIHEDTYADAHATIIDAHLEHFRPGCFAWAEVVLAEPQDLKFKPTHFGRIGLWSLRQAARVIPGACLGR